MTTPLVVLDATNLARRAYHAGGSALVLRTAERVRALMPGAEVIACWDSPPPYWRHELYPDYKGHRLGDPQATLFVRAEAKDCRAAELPGRWAPTMEADDVACTLLAAHQGPAAFVTTDQDWCQMLDLGARWLVPEAGGLVERDAGWVWERGGVAPCGWPEYVALKGDASDNIPGAPGVGPHRASVYLRAHGSLEAAIAACPELGAQGEALRLYAVLATLRDDCELRGC
jgi:DNA polymerase-1